MPIEVLQVLALYIVAVGGMSVWFHLRESDLDNKINELVKNR